MRSAEDRPPAFSTWTAGGSFGAILVDVTDVRLTLTAELERVFRVGPQGDSWSPAGVLEVNLRW